MKDVYLRDPSDSKYRPLLLETGDKIEILLNKIRMILLTDRGEVLGEPSLGLSLEHSLFETVLDEGAIKEDFYAQLGKYVPEISDYKIDLDVEYNTDGVKNEIFLIININDQKQFAIVI